MSSAARALTVLVVAHNDSQTLLPTIERLFRALTVTIEDFAVVIFDDGSTDDTYAVAQQAASTYPFVSVRRNERRMGPGYCTVAGSADASTPQVVYVPADNTWPVRSFIELFGNVGKADVVASYSNNLLRSMPLPKRTISRCYTLILNLLFRKGIHYYNGLAIYPVEYIRRGAVRTHGFGFQAEALLKAIASGYSFLEIALSVDVDNVAKSRSLTLPNVLNAGATIARLVADVYLLRRLTPVRRPVPSPSASRRRDGLRIVLTGGSSGIGATLARALAADGHQVYICARRADRLAQVSASSARIRSRVCDVADEVQVADFARFVSSEVSAIDVLINCAGDIGEIGPITLADPGRWWGTVQTNVRGTYLVTWHFLPLLKGGNAPRILNFSGGGAFNAFPNYSAYACSKAAIVRLTECLAEELAPIGIRVNALAPGSVATEMHQATLAAGEERAGRLQFHRTRALLDGPEPAMENVVSCVRRLISPLLDDLTGKTISANFDPWQTDGFLECLPEIVRSDLYTLRRVNVVNLPEGWLRRTLSQPWTDAPPRS